MFCSKELLEIQPRFNHCTSDIIFFAVLEANAAGGGGVGGRHFKISPRGVVLLAIRYRP